MNLFAGKEWRCKIENGHVDTAGEGEGGMSWESSSDLHTLSCVKWRASGKLPNSTGRSTWCSVMTWAGGAGGRPKREGIVYINIHTYGPPGWASGEESACQFRRCRRCRFYPWVGEILWSKKWQPTPVFLPGKIPCTESLVGYSPWGHRE